VTSMAVKRTLDQALLDAGVRSSTARCQDALLDAGGNPAGVVMANRPAGRLSWQRL